MDYPTPCTAGNYCPGISQTDVTPCSTGTFSTLTHMEEDAECQPCISGAYCTTTGRTTVEGQCSSGYFCLVGSTSPTPTMNTNYGPCPNFLYCDVTGGTGVGSGSVCYPGTYHDSEGLAALIECTSTPAGEYSNTIDLTDPIAPTMTRGDCDEGYYCSASVYPHRANLWPTNTTTFCDVGQYCPIASTSTTDCDPGYFQFNKV